MYGYRGHVGGGPGIFGVIFFLVLLVLAVVAIVALVRMLRSPRPEAVAPSPPVTRGEDSALAELRLRYARGEIDRDDFLGRLRDLGGRVPDSPPPPSPRTAPTPSVNP